MAGCLLIVRTWTRRIANLCLVLVDGLMVFEELSWIGDNLLWWRRQVRHIVTFSYKTMVSSSTDLGDNGEGSVVIVDVPYIWVPVTKVAATC